MRLVSYLWFDVEVSEMDVNSIKDVPHVMEKGRSVPEKDRKCADVDNGKGSLFL